MTKLIREWVLVACWALLSTSCLTANAQEVSATGNLVYTTVNPAPAGADPYSWSGFVVTESNGGGFSGGNVPAYNPTTGTFLFGYTQGKVSYITAINHALQQAGTGIQVGGLKYSWEYFNQDFSRGSLTGNISLTSNAGQMLHSYNYNLPQTTTGWTKMSGVENFNAAYSPTSLGNLSVSFTGKDDRFWAGYYGPQIRDIGVNLLYTAAPPPIQTDFEKWVKLTDENGTFTLTKTSVVRYGAEGVYMYQNLQPGTYECSNNAWGNDPIGGVYKACSVGTNTTTTTTIPKPPDNTTTIIAPTAIEPVLAPTTTISVAPTTTTSSVVVEPSAPATSQTTSSSSSVSTTTTQTASATSTAPSANNSQTKVGEVTVSGSANKTTMSTSQVLAIVRSEQTRIGNLETSTAQQAVEQAQAAGDKAQQESLSISAATISQSQSSAQASVSMFSGASTTNNNQVSNQNSLTNSLANMQTPTARTQSIYSLIPPTQTQSSETVAVVSPQISYSLNRVESSKVQEEPIKVEEIKFNSTNPIFNIINAPLFSQQSTQESQGASVVNNKAQNNEIAGNVSLEAMAIQPRGFDSYMGVIPDVSFYASKEIYRNQRTLDNARALRQLSSDRLHQEMINQQYRK